ncbi:MAG: YeeE/YedE thiosulfate transporter family protein [Burkholderiales bacterium]
MGQSLLLDVTSITYIDIPGCTLWVAARQADVHANPLNGSRWAVRLSAGFVMGYSSRLEFGCNIGAMLTGISNGSLHGWIWVPMAIAGTLIGIRMRRQFSF